MNVCFVGLSNTMVSISYAFPIRAVVCYIILQILMILKLKIMCF